MPKENVNANVMYVVTNVMSVVVVFMDLPKKWIIVMVYKYIYSEYFLSFHCKVADLLKRSLNFSVIPFDGLI